MSVKTFWIAGPSSPGGSAMSFRIRTIGSRHSPSGSGTSSGCGQWAAGCRGCKAPRTRRGGRRDGQGRGGRSGRVGRAGRGGAAAGRAAELWVAHRLAGDGRAVRAGCLRRARRARRRRRPARLRRVGTGCQDVGAALGRVGVAVAAGRRDGVVSSRPVRDTVMELRRRHGDDDDVEPHRSAPPTRPASRRPRECRRLIRAPAPEQDAGGASLIVDGGGGALMMLRCSACANALAAANGTTAAGSKAELWAESMRLVDDQP